MTGGSHIRLAVALLWPAGCFASTEVPRVSGPGPETVQAFDQYVRLTESVLDARLHGEQDFLWPLPFAYNDLINAGVKAKYNLSAAPTYFGLGFSWMKTLELGVTGSGTLDSTKIRDYLRTRKFDLPYGKGITFDKRGLPPPFAFAVQTTNGQVEPVWPKNVATATLVYPRPAWSR